MSNRNTVKRLDKNTIEKACRNAGMRPVHRDKLQGREVFIADGFSSIPHIVFGRFGVEPGDFPSGCYGTLWFLAVGDALDAGAPLFFKPDHNPELEKSGRQGARINAALREAERFLTARRKVRLNG